MKHILVKGRPSALRGGIFLFPASGTLHSTTLPRGYSLKGIVPPKGKEFLPIKIIKDVKENTVKELRGTFNYSLDLFTFYWFVEIKGNLDSMFYDNISDIVYQVSVYLRSENALVNSFWASIGMIESASDSLLIDIP